MSRSQHLTLNNLRSGLLDETAQRALLAQSLADFATSNNHDDAATQALAAQAFEVADYLSYALLNQQRYAEAREIVEQALQAGKDSALLHTLALSEHALGESKQAMTHLEQALKQLGETADAETNAMRTDLLEHLAQIQQDQGQHLRAIQSLERAAELLHANAELEGYMRCKTELAKLAHDLGDALQASEHWLDILGVARAPEANNAFNQHAARALLQLAELARESENTEMEMSLRGEALEVLAEAGMVKELAQTLFQIARSQNQREPMWQAVWLMLAITQNIDGLINAHAWLYMREDQKTDPDASLLAAAIWATIESLPNDKVSEDIARQARTTRMALSQLFTCARIQGVHETEITAWMEHEKMRLQDGVIHTMLSRIESQREPSVWLFDLHKFKH
ncbi:MAG: hypothetical protein PHF20_02605 [Halothiobacillaceae bacterium]|nr:hypothetical protein [Halothiobacillaceae bacterium]